MKISPHGWAGHACILTPLPIEHRSEMILAIGQTWCDPSAWNVLTALPYPKALISKISCYDKDDRTYPHRNLPAGNNHLPFKDEPRGMSDPDDEKDCTS